jgi:DNA-3-methyladenine glycosylase II
MQASWWQDAIKHLRNNDPIIAEFIDKYQGEILESREKLVETLMRSIVGQQISVLAAATVWRRLNEHLGEVIPKSVLQSSTEDLRSCGLSQRKVEYIQGIAKRSDELQKVDWQVMDDEEAIELLCTLKGVGRWTAEMVLIFTLLRPDILPLGDIGLIRGMERLYNEGDKMSKQELLNTAEAWRPYASAATWYIWRSMDPEPVQY